MVMIAKLRILKKKTLSCKTFSILKNWRLMALSDTLFVWSDNTI